MRGISIAMTGGMGCGKSEAGRCFEALGLEVRDADAVAREVVEPDQPAWKEIVSYFGPGVVGSSGALDRRALAARVFGAPAERKVLEAIIHPRVRAVMTAWREAVLAAGRDAVGIIPLLFESAGRTGWDVVLCISASPAVVRDRLASRGWTESECEARIAAQWPLAEKEQLADFVVRNEGSVADLKASIEAFYGQLRERRNKE